MTRVCEGVLDTGLRRSNVLGDKGSERGTQEQLGKTGVLFKVAYRMSKGPSRAAKHTGRFLLGVYEYSLSVSLSLCLFPVFGATRKTKNYGVG